MLSLLNAIGVSLKEHQKEEDERKALKARIDAKDKAQKDELEAMLKRVHEVIQAFDNQWLANDYVILDDLIWVLAKANSIAHDTHKKVIQEAVTIDALAVWNAPIEEQYKLNASIRQTGHLPAQTLVLKKDFIHWWQQTQAVPFPPRLFDLATIATTKTSKPTRSLVPKEILKALNDFLEEIEKRAIQNNVSFDRLKMFGIKSQLHDLAKLHCSGLFEKSPHTFYDYLKNSGLCKFHNGNRWSPLYSELFPEYPKLKNRETRVKTK